MIALGQKRDLESSGLRTDREEIHQHAAWTVQRKKKDMSRFIEQTPCIVLRTFQHAPLQGRSLSQLT